MSQANNLRIYKNTLLLYIRMGISMLISLYTSRIVLQVLGEEDYGIMAVVGGITSLFTFMNGALSGATQRFLTFELGKNNQTSLKKIFNAAFINHLILSLIILILCETIGLWFLYHKLVIPEIRMSAAIAVYQFSIIGTCLGIILVPFNSLIMAHEKMGVYAYLSIFDVLLKLALVIILQYIAYDKLIFWAAGGLLTSMLYQAFNILYCRKNFAEAHFEFYKEKKLYLQMFSYSFWDFLGSLSTLAQGQGLNMLLNMFFGPIVNAARGIAMTVQGAIVQFSSNFVVASKPQIIKLYAEGNIQEMMRLVYQTSNLSYFLLYLFALPLCIELDYVLTLWLGEYPEYTVTFAILIIANSLTWSIKSLRVTVLHATGEIKLSNLTVGVILCLTLPVSYFFLKLGYSPISVFVITLIMTLLAEFVACFVLKKYLDYSIKDYLLQVYGRCILVSVLSFPVPFILHSIMPSGFIRLCTVTLVSTLSLCIFAYYYGFSKEVRDKTFTIIKNRISKILYRK